MNKNQMPTYLTLIMLAVALFFQLADSKTFSLSLWEPLSRHTGRWSAKEWNDFASSLVPFLAGVWSIFVVKRGLVVGGLSSRRWYIASALLVLTAAFKFAVWVS